MTRWRGIAPLLIAANLSGGGVYGQTADPNAADREAIAAVLETFVKAFNARDSAALSVVWGEKAVYHSATSGKSDLVGRAAVADGYAALFKGDPQGSLSLDADSLTFPSAGKALAAGVATVDHDKFAPSRSRFAAQLAKVGESWLIERVDEADLPPSAEAGLAPLSPLVGTWVEESVAGRVVNQFSWADNHAFLVRRFWHEPKAGAAASATAHGTEIFGWDAEALCIRTWLFDANGSFGEGVCAVDGPTWISSSPVSKWRDKLVLKATDGRRASMTQVIKRLGDDQLSMQTIDREVDGAAVPNGPVAKLTRQAESAAVGATTTGGTR